MIWSLIVVATLCAGRQCWQQVDKYPVARTEAACRDVAAAYLERYRHASTFCVPDNPIALQHRR